MFTGIIEALGRVRQIEPQRDDIRLTLESGGLDLGASVVGDSIACNGVCLTATALTRDSYSADLSRETLRHTTLGELSVGAAVHLERALTLSRPLGGHLVSGHVDGIGEVIARHHDGRSLHLTLRAPAELARYIARKGSICVDGVSLTVNQVQGAEFTLNIVPHTAAQTLIGHYRPGSRVNLEVDLIARYLERLLLGEAESPATAGSGVTLELLQRSGFA